MLGYSNSRCLKSAPQKLRLELWGATLIGCKLAPGTEIGSRVQTRETPVVGGFFAPAP